MKSYVLIAADFVTTGGMDRANYALADYLARQGFSVHLVAYRVAESLLNYGNVCFHSIPKVGQSDFLSEPFFRRIAYAHAKRLAASGARVLVNGGNCQWTGTNWVHYLHAAYQPENRAGWLQSIKGTLSHHYFRHTERRSLLASQLIIANSERTRQDILRVFPLSSDRIQVIYYGIDPTLFYPVSVAEQTTLRHQLKLPLQKKLVMFIGALGDRRKGFDTLFSVWQQLCQDPTWDGDLMVIGSGAELPRWQQKTQDAGLGDRIHFLGFRRDVPELLRAGDCLVAPTRYEAYGLGVHEALCCGLPALVSATAGVAEHYSPSLQDLLLSDPNNIEDLEKTLRQWRRSPDHYRNQTLMLSDQLRQHTWDHMAAEVLSSINSGP